MRERRAEPVSEREEEVPKNFSSVEFTCSKRQVKL
jgi:hypothetical protein